MNANRFLKPAWRLIRVLLLLGLAATAGSCCTVDPVVMKSLFLNITTTEGRLPNWIGMHQNPKVGDFAEHISLDGLVLRYEIVAREGKYFEVAHRYLTAPPQAHVLAEFSFNLIVDEQGNVREGFLVDLATGQRYPVRIAKPGENGYVASREIITNRRIVDEAIVTPAGEFLVSDFRVLESDLAQNGVVIKVTQTQLIHPNVKFQVVRVRTAASTEFPAVSVIRTIYSYVPGDPVKKQVIDFILGKLEKQEYRAGADLLRMN